MIRKELSFQDYFEVLFLVSTTQYKNNGFEKTSKLSKMKRSENVLLLTYTLSSQLEPLEVKEWCIEPQQDTLTISTTKNKKDLSLSFLYWTQG